MSIFYTFHTFTENDIDPLGDLQKRYAEVHPYRTVTPGQAYLSPSFANGQHVLCASDADGHLLAYGAFYPQQERAWVHILPLPGLAESDAIKHQLYDWLVERARQSGQTRLAFQLFPAEDEYIRYVQSKGARYAYSVYTMQRLLDQPIPDYPVPDEFSVRRLRMQDEAEQRAYVTARNECFPEDNITPQEWQFLVCSPWWAQGVCVVGLAGDVLAGSVSVFWEPDSPNGMTEYVFTRPAFRGKGLASALLTESLRYLKEHGLRTATLEVKADNESALGLYRGLGCAVIQESRVYEIALPALSL